MRIVLAGVVLIAATALTTAQEVKEPPPRYGATPRVKLYPQTTAKAALKSSLALLEKGEYTYFVAHMLDPQFVDERVALRAKLFEPTAEEELLKLRDFQKANPDKVLPENRVPLRSEERSVGKEVERRRCVGREV